MNDKTMQVSIKNVYGRETMYPANEAAHVIAALANQKTLTSREIKLAERLGYTVEQVERIQIAELIGTN